MKVVLTKGFQDDMERLFSPKLKYRLARGWEFISYELWRNLKDTVQRSKRGYAETDVWDLNSYLCSWLPQAIRELKSNNKKVLGAHPIGVKNRKEWDKILEKMAKGFEAKEKLFGLGIKNPKTREKVEKVAKEGLALFIKHFDGLWD